MQNDSFARKGFAANSFSMRSLWEPTEVQSSGSLNAALIGDVIASLGARNGWSGVVINGSVRDSAVLREIDFGVKALGTNPRKSKKDGNGASDLLVHLLA
jgi:regulator of ribonuclease activity A